MRHTLRRSLVLLLLATGFPCLVFSSCSNRAAENSPQAAAYRAYVQAVKAANIATWKTLVTAQHLDLLKMWCDELKKGTPEQFVANTPVVQDELRFTGLSVKGNEATLRIAGKRSGTKVKGEITLALEDGTWKIFAESYDN
jgi:hypothetical protein